ncbi:zinc finger protein 704 isoform X3 [Electrophorus electricus]|uniref:zinc finger protein 704 isoform X3 n=1 Tax=Electrophorus electricus TaxID=8005 RepID=UPI0015D018C7|nr:zinc finger protein 704 isoform X3 [Electrophorus electricus]XP_035384808.1 zinc finger protein 704 isoform X3 [Electrophorus electricus]
MHTRRLVKRSIIGSRVYAPGPTGDAAPLTGVVQAVKQDNRDASAGHRCNVYTVLMQDGSLKEYSEEEIAIGSAQMAAKGPLKSSLKNSCNGSQRDGPAVCPSVQRSESTPLGREGPEEPRRLGRAPEQDKDHTRSVSLLEQKRKVVSSSIDVPHARKSEEEVDMDKVTAAMVLTSLSTSPLVRSPPVKMGEGLNGSWKDGGFMPSSYSSSGYWSWSAPSDHSNPSTPSPPLSADSFKPFRAGSLSGPPDDALDEQDAGSLLFDEPIPRKRKNSMKVMFKCLWKNCGKVLSTAAGIQRHIRTVHLGRNCDSECSDGEEDFYYTEIKLNTDSVADGLSSLSPVSPSVLSPPPSFEHRKPDTSGSTAGSRNESSSSTPLSRSAPSTLYLVHADHAYQATAPVNIPCTSTACSTPSTHTAGFTPSTSCSISWQSPPVTFTGTPASPTHGRTQGFSEQRSQTITVLSSPPRAAGSLSRKSRGEGKKCRKVYGMENRDMWCTACRWKKACQRPI